ncbi:MAG TPA: ATP-binding protein [Pyrinomonadaceae bacterium]|jgi:PAS domain S-box-containing protein|nr:ATP-binding protein [Pyrinomonadaceae bacterium]
MQPQTPNSILQDIPDNSVLPAETISPVLSAVFDALPDAIYLFGSDRRLMRANGAAAQLQSGALENGKPCCEMFWHVEGADECVVDRALKTRERVEVEIQVGPEGQASISLIVEPLIEDSFQLTALVIARDISDLRRAEAEAIAHKSFIASIADRTPDEIYALDGNCRITWMNERAEAYKLSPAPGAGFADIVATESRASTEENLRRTLVGEDTDYEVRVSRLDGSARYAEAHTSPLWKNGEIDGALVFLRDITDRKREHELMAQSDKLRAVGELAAGVAHNLNNSLTVIQGRAQLLLRNATDEVSSKSLQVITNAVEDGTKTLRRILEFARRDSASEFAPVELGYLITSSIDIARPKWQSKSRKGTIEVKVEGNGLVYVMGEQAELREVVLNLIFNAVDAMPEDGVMEIGSRGEIDSGCFWVADTGCGMPQEVASRIFEPFFTTKGKLGSGLGLSASHGIITRHQGEIIVVSEPGEGTRFEVRLPICDKSDRFVKNAEPSSET